MHFRGKWHDLQSKKKSQKNWFLFVEKSEILGGFYLEQKKRFFCIKKNILSKIVKSVKKFL